MLAKNGFCGIVGAALEKTMLPSGRKKHSIPKSSGRETYLPVTRDPQSLDKYKQFKFQ